MDEEDDDEVELPEQPVKPIKEARNKVRIHPDMNALLGGFSCFCSKSEFVRLTSEVALLLRLILRRASVNRLVRLHKRLDQGLDRGSERKKGPQDRGPLASV